MPNSLQATSGTCCKPNSWQISAVPSSSAKRIISGLGCNNVQLMTALRCIIAKWPLNGLGQANIVIVVTSY